MLSHAAKLASVTLACLGIVVALTSTDDDRRQLKTSYELIRNINLTAAASNRLSEQIAELFILDGHEADIEEARDALLSRLDKQRDLVQAQLDLDGNRGARQRDLEQIAQMEDLVSRIDQSRKVLEAYLEAGRTDDAAERYSRDFENLLDIMLAQLIDDAMLREREAVDTALANSDRLSQQSMILAISLVIVFAVLGLGNVVMVDRTIMRPIAELVSGVDAVGRGDLAHVVGSDARDELGHLAARFNAMTRQLKEQRDALVAAKSDLADQVDARTSDLRDRTDELEATNARLRDVDASRANFFADISHELRTPLTILRGQAEVTVRDMNATQDDLREALNGCIRKADHMGRLVDDLLFLARSESGSIMVARDRVILQDVVSGILLDGKGLSLRDDVTIRPHQPAAPIVVVGDGKRLHQAVLIVLDNAVRFAPSGTTIDVELGLQAHQAVISVRDAGPGLTEEELGSAFTRFNRGAPCKPRSGRGLGLGLSIAKWIVDQHAGEIHITTGPDGGARGEITIPTVPMLA